MVSKGIIRERITATGYGESELLNKCADGVTCTPQEHRENRRTEIFIPGFGKGENIKQGKGDYSEVKNDIILDYDYFDFAHATVPVSLPSREFYKSWINLYYKSYPVVKNFGNFIMKKLCFLTGNKNLGKKYNHLNLTNLFRLRLYGLFLTYKLARHYNYPKSRKVADPEVYPSR